MMIIKNIQANYNDLNMFGVEQHLFIQPSWNINFLCHLFSLFFEVWVLHTQITGSGQIFHQNIKTALQLDRNLLNTARIMKRCVLNRFY